MSTVTLEEAKRFIEQQESLSYEINRDDDGTEPMVCRYEATVVALINGTKYIGTATKENDLREGSAQVQGARANPLFGDLEATERLLAHYRRNLPVVTRLEALRRAVQDVIIRSGWSGWKPRERLPGISLL